MINTDVQRTANDGRTPPVQTNASLQTAFHYLTSVQNAQGFWEGEMVWNTMLLSQYILVRRMTGRWPIGETDRTKMIRHYQVSQLDDGSFPMHIEGNGYVYFTVMAYVALRVLGVPADDPMCDRALAWLKARGDEGVLAVPSWGKFWLAMLGLYGWEGVNSIPPELFILPADLPIHPKNFYNHTRYIYLGIAFLYGRRFEVNLGPLGESLRQELYDEPFDQIRFAKHRHHIALSDKFVAPTLPLKASWDALSVWERWPIAAVRKRALAFCFDRICYEIQASRGQGISPVNGLLNCLALYSENPNHPELDRAMAAMESWKWDDEEEGIRYTGAHSTAWDTAFAMHSIVEAPAEAARDSCQPLLAAYQWLRATQMQEELPAHHEQWRDPILGGWCFSDGQHRWPVSDCTAEALSAILETHKRLGGQGLLPPVGQQFTVERLTQAAQFILRRQNDDGGFGSYEKRRGSAILEMINPSEMYSNCMTELSYTECTASCVGALVRFKAAHPGILDQEIGESVERAIALLRKRQLADGSYAGFWGINFIYGIFHVVEALTTSGVTAADPAIGRAAEWLLEKQKADGGWGERWQSCLSEKYDEHPESQATMTAWALLALMRSIPASHPAIKRGITFLRGLQQKNGSWPRQSQAGVFFSTAILDYKLYKDYFPAWALARYASLTT